jgi:tripartite ATP-independent transporter DctP family solute receptor
MSNPYRKPLVQAVLALALLVAGSCVLAAPVVLKLGHVSGSDPKDNWQAGATKFAELVEAKSKGEVKVQVFPSSQLGNDRDMAEGMRLGSVDFSLNAGVLSNFEPRLGLLELPYIFRDAEHMRKVLNGPVGDELASALLKSGIRVVGWWERGPRELTANKEVKTLADLKGMKIRVPEIPVSVDSWRAMGANPTPMAFGEVYTGLQQKVIDGQENPLAIIDSAKLNEVQKYLMKTDHVYGYVALAMSEKTYQKLTPEQRSAIVQAAKEATAFENKLVWENEEKLAKDLKGKGMQFVDVNKTEFAAAVKPVHAIYAQKLGKDLYDKIVGTK